MTRGARDFSGERAKLLNHRVECVLDQQNLATHVDGDLFRKVPLAMAAATSAMFLILGEDHRPIDPAGDADCFLTTGVGQIASRG